MSKRLKSVGVMRLVALALILGLLAGMAPDRASAAQERGGGTYMSSNYGYTVSWDDSTWSSEPNGDIDGIRLTKNLSFGLIQAVLFDGDSAECVEQSVADMSDDADVSKFRKASRKFERPATAREAERELYTYTNLDGNNRVAMYVECRPLKVDDAVLQVILITGQADYTLEAPEWEVLLQEIVVGNAKSTDVRDDTSNSMGRIGMSTRAAGIDGDIYFAPEFGFAVTWDLSDWEVIEIQNEEEMGQGVEVSTDETIGWITVGEPLNGEFADCAVAYAEGVGSYEIITKFREASSKFDVPATARNAVGGLYTFRQASEGGDSFKMIGYFECRELGDGGTVAMIFLATQQEFYEDELPLWEDLLDGIEIDGVSATVDAEPVDEDDSDEQAADGAEGPFTRGNSDTSAVSADVSFVGSNFGFTVRLDESIWTMNDVSSDKVDYLDIESEFAVGSIVAFGGAYDAAGCIERLLGLKNGEGLISVDVAASSMERPRTVRKAAGELFIFTYEGSEGPIEIVTYIECRPHFSGNATVGVMLSTVPRIYTDALSAFESVLAGVETAQEA